MAKSGLVRVVQIVHSPACAFGTFKIASSSSTWIDRINTHLTFILLLLGLIRRELYCLDSLMSSRYCLEGFN